MSERYTRLFSLPENIGQDGCPVLISAGALLKDNNTGKVLVQLKLRNISEQVIRSVRVKINAYDTAGIALKGIESFSYLDLTVERDGEFGSKTPIVLPDKTTRSVSVEILSVVYGHREIYQSGNSAVADFIDSATQEKIQILNKERNEKAKREIALQQAKKQKIFNYLAFIPAVLDICAIILLFTSDYWEIENLNLCWRAILLSFFTPCLCLLSSRLKKQKNTFLKISLIVSVVCILIQLCSALVYNNFMHTLYETGYGFSAFQFECYSFIEENIGGCHLLFFLKRGFARVIKNHQMDQLLAEFGFWAKNICVIILSILQTKGIKKQVAERMESK